MVRPIINLLEREWEEGETDSRRQQESLEQQTYMYLKSLASCVTSNPPLILPPRVTLSLVTFQIF